MSSVPDVPLTEGLHARFLDVPGGPLAVHDADPVGERRGTVLLVPGFTGSKEDFRLVLEPLAAQGWRCVALDQRGQYQSPGPDDLALYTTEALGADLLHVVDALGDGPVHLVAHSFGGLVARSAVLQDRSRFASLVLMDSGPSALTGKPVAAFPFLEPILADGGLEALWEVSQSLPPDPDRPTYDEDVVAFSRVRYVSGSATALLGMSQALLAEPDRVDELAATDLPVAIVYGEKDDRWTPAEQDEMAERLGAPVLVIPGSFHSPAAEQPALTAQVLNDVLRSMQ